MDAQLINAVHQHFDTYEWTDPRKARALVNEGISLATSGNNKALEPIINELRKLVILGKGKDMLGL